MNKKIYEDLWKVISKEFISSSELRKIVDNELVVKISPGESHPHKKKYIRHDIILENNEYHIVYVKKSLF